jgi:hypothetical protein
MNNTFTSEAENYIVGILTQYGVTRLDTGKAYTMSGALARANEMNETCEAELKAIRGNKFVAIKRYD